MSYALSLTAPNCVPTLRTVSITESIFAWGKQSASATIGDFAEEREEAISIVRQQSSKEEYLDSLMKQREPYINARNNIIDNPFKYFLPYYKKKLREIDSKLDEIELEIYHYESQNLPSKSELEKIVLETRLEVNEYLANKTKK